MYSLRSYELDGTDKWEHLPSPGWGFEEMKRAWGWGGGHGRGFREAGHAESTFQWYLVAIPSDDYTATWPTWVLDRRRQDRYCSSTGDIQTLYQVHCVDPRLRSCEDMLGRSIASRTIIRQATIIIPCSTFRALPTLLPRPRPSRLSQRQPSARRSIMTARLDNDKEYRAISQDETIYQPFLLSPIPGAEKTPDGELAVDKDDWVQGLELDHVKEMVKSVPEGRRVKILIMYGSLRERSAIFNSVYLDGLVRTAKSRNLLLNIALAQLLLPIDGL